MLCMYTCSLPTCTRDLCTFVSKQTPDSCSRVFPFPAGSLTAPSPRRQQSTSFRLSRTITTFPRLGLRSSEIVHGSIVFMYLWRRSFHSLHAIGRSLFFCSTVKNMKCEKVPMSCLIFIAEYVCASKFRVPVKWHKYQK